MKQMKTAALLILTTAALAAAVAADTDSSTTGDGGNGAFAERRWAAAGHAGPMGHLARHLDLSEAQQAEIRSIMETMRSDSEPLRQQLRETRSQLHELVHNDEFYEDQVRILAESQSRTLVELTVLGARTRNAVYNVLTPEQRAKAEEMRRNRPRRGHRYSGPGFEPGMDFGAVPAPLPE